MTPRDRDRSAVYAAELAAFEGTDLEEVRPFDAVARLGHRVVATPWWPGGAVELRRARVDAHSSSTRCGAESSVVRIAGSQATVATVAHELAHALAGGEIGHGPVFRRAYLDVVEVATNLDSIDRRGALHVAQLADAFATAGLSIGARTWPAPPPQSSGAIVL